LLRQEIVAAIRSAGLPDPRLVEALILDSIRIEATAAEEPGLPLGASKIGGLPDLPTGVPWPEWRNGPLSFIAQLRLEDLAPFDSAKVLPQRGILYFFYDREQGVWGFDPDDHGGWRILFHEGAASGLKRTPTPSNLPEESRYSSCALRSSQDATVPPVDAWEIRPYGLMENDAYWDFLDRLAPEGEPIHRVFGYPDQIQNEMRTECQLVSHGIYHGDLSWKRDPRAADLAKGAPEWRLLLQIDSDERPGFMWGDSGRLYYWIREADLHGRNFDNAWLVLQCG